LIQLFLDFFTPDLFWLHAAMVFAFGALWGSFFGLCIARIPAGQSIVVPGSYCFSCGKEIVWYDNIPLYSYVALGARCRWCGTVFSSRHFWIELLSGVLFVWAFHAQGYTLNLIPTWIFIGLLVISTFTDLDHWIIPDRVSLGGAAIGIVVAFIPWPAASQMAIEFRPSAEFDNIVFHAGPFNAWSEAWWTAPANAIFGAAFGYSLMWAIGKIGTLLFRKEAMGGGDMKLLACFGAFMGYINCLYTLVLACLLGSVIGISLIVYGRWQTRRMQDAGKGEDLDAQDSEALAIKAMASLYPDYDAEDPARRPERKALLHLLTQPSAGKVFRHHLPFGPYLAAGAFLVLLYHHVFKRCVDAYLSLSGGF